MRARIAVVSDSREQESPLAALLRKARYEVGEYRVGSRIGGDVRSFSPEMVVYDCRDPGGPSETVLASTRNALEVPILVVGPTHDETFVIRALRMGADGCLCRPCGASEFLARVEAHMRRHWEYGMQQEQAIDEGLLVNALSSSALVGGREVKLTPTEYRLLHRLAEADGRVVTRQELFSYLWGVSGQSVDRNALNLYIFNLRKKIERDPHRPQHILTKWGIGYYLSRGPSRT
jgi:two-component system, OmpR family, KDP operon response regulator KdpE